MPCPSILQNIISRSKISLSTVDFGQDQNNLVWVQIIHKQHFHFSILLLDSCPKSYGPTQKSWTSPNSFGHIKGWDISVIFQNSELETPKDYVQQDDAVKTHRSFSLIVFCFASRYTIGGHSKTTWTKVYPILITYPLEWTIVDILHATLYSRDQA